MGYEVLEDIIDIEIRHIVKLLNELSFIQTLGSCSGYSYDINTKNGASETEHSVWIGNPYVYLMSLNEEKTFKYISYIIKKMSINYASIFQTGKRLELLAEYKEVLNTVDLDVGATDLININLLYRECSLCFIIHINETGRTEEDVKKIWQLFYNLTLKYEDI